MLTLSGFHAFVTTIICKFTAVKFCLAVLSSSTPLDCNQWCILYWGGRGESPGTHSLPEINLLEFWGLLEKAQNDPGSSLGFTLFSIFTDLGYLSNGFGKLNFLVFIAACNSRPEPK